MKTGFHWAWIFILLVLGNIAANGETNLRADNESQYGSTPTLSISPGYNFTGNPKYDLTAHILRERLIQVLTGTYQCRVVSRNYGILLTRENALRAIKGVGAPAPLPAEWILTPILTVNSSSQPVWKISYMDLREDVQEIRFASGTLQPDPLLAREATERELKDLGAKLNLRLRKEDTELSASDWSDLRFAVMPAIVLLNDKDNRKEFPFSELLEFSLQKSGKQTLSRQDLAPILREHEINTLLGSTELFAAAIGKLAGVDLLIRPVVLPDKKGALSVSLSVIYTRSGAVNGVVSTSLEDLSDWVNVSDTLITRFLEQQPILSEDPRDFTEPLKKEAEYHLEMVKRVADNATGTVHQVIKAGLEHAQSSYYLSANHPQLVTELLREVDENLITPPAFYWNTYGDTHSRHSSDTGTPIRELMDELLRQLDSLGHPPEQAHYLRARAAYIGGEYRHALSILRDKDVSTNNEVFLECILLILLDRERECVDRLESYTPKSKDLFRLLAICHHRLRQPLREMEALEEYIKRNQNIFVKNTVSHLLDLLLIHGTPEQRKFFLESVSDKWLLVQPEVLYFTGRVHEEQNLSELAAQAYESARRTSSPRHRIGIGKTNLHEDIEKRLSKLKPGKPTELKKAADIFTFPKTMKVYIQPLGDVDQNQIRLVAHRVGWFFGVNVEIRPSIPLPSYSGIYSENRNQYHATGLRNILTDLYPIPKDAVFMVYYTHQDLYASGLRWLYSSTTRGYGILYSDFRYRLFYNMTSGDLAEASSRSICGSQVHLWRRLLSDAEIQKLTGSTEWPNSPRSITFSNGKIDGPLQAEGFHYDDDTAALYATLSPDEILSSFQSDYRIRQKRTLRQYTTPEEQQDFKSQLHNALAGETPLPTKMRPELSEFIHLNPGLRRSEYLGKWQQLPDFTSLEAVTSTFTSEIAITEGLPEDHYGLVFEGWVLIPAAGEYGLHLSSDDGSRLRLGDWQINNDGTHGNRSIADVRHLDAGRYPLKVEYFENSGGQSLNVMITTPENVYDTIPSEWLFHTVPPNE